MGLWKNKQLEQDELDAFVDALYMGRLNDPEDFDYEHGYESIPREFNERTIRDPRTGRFVAKATGIDYHWNENTIVFADDSNWQKPMVIKTTARKAA